jgi:transcriptional regulator with XRE-family HTH domain
MNKGVKAIVGEKIKEARLAKGLSQEQLAHLLGVRQNAISNIENGKSFPSLELALKAASLLDLSLDLVNQEIHQPQPQEVTNA